MHRTAGANRQNKGSSPVFHNDEWLDFNFTYSGHNWGYPTYEQIARDRALDPVKPTLDGEPLYENHPAIGDGTGFYSNRKLWDGITRGTSHQIRQSAYWAMLAGAAGHTYGCHDVWQFHNELSEPITHSNVMWYEAVDFDGPRQMGLMRRLFESRPWQKLVPDQSVIAAGQREGELHIQAARARDGSFLLAYLPQGGTVPSTCRNSPVSESGLPGSIRATATRSQPESSSEARPRASKRQRAAGYGIGSWCSTVARGSLLNLTYS